MNKLTRHRAGDNPSPRVSAFQWRSSYGYGQGANHLCKGDRAVLFCDGIIYRPKYLSLGRTLRSFRRNDFQKLTNVLSRQLRNVNLSTNTDALDLHIEGCMEQDGRLFVTRKATLSSFHLGPPGWALKVAWWVRVQQATVKRMLNRTNLRSLWDEDKKVLCT